MTETEARPSGAGDPEAVPAAARWGTIGQVGGQVMRLVTLLVLARVLGPARIGLLEMALFVIGFVEVIKSIGTAEFLIREREPSQLLLASVFVVNVAAGVVLSAALWFGAGLIAPLLGNPQAGELAGWLGLTFVILSFSNVHEALLRRQLRFKRLAVVLFGGPFIYAAAAVPAALSGAGEMAFVWGGLAEAVATTGLLWALAGWRPRGGFAWREARRAFHFSAFLTASEVVRWLTSMADRLLVGRWFGEAALGKYGLARRLLMQVTKPLLLVFSKVVLPALAHVQGDEEAVRRRYLRAVASVALVAFPLTIGLAAVAEPFVALLDPDKWTGTVPLIRIFAPVAALQAVASTVGVLYMVKNRTDLLFLWSVVSGGAVLAGYFAGRAWGLDGIAFATVIVMVLLVWPAFAIPLRLIGLRPAVVAATLLPSLVMSLVMGVFAFGVVTLLQMLSAGSLVALPAAVLVGGAVYLVLLRVVQPVGLENLLEAVPRRFAPWVRGLSPTHH